MSVKQFIQQAFGHFFEIQPSARQWHLPLVTALGVFLPALLGALTGRFADGVTAAMGTLLLIYFPVHANLWAQLQKLLFCILGFLCCFVLGLTFGGMGWISAIASTLITAAIYYLCKRLQVMPPGYFFFIMIFTVAMAMPIPPKEMSAPLLLFACGNVWALLLGLGYGLTLKGFKHQQTAPAPVPPFRRRELLAESVIMGLAMGASYAIAHLYGLNSVHWIMISCAAVMQGNNTRHIWQRKLHRIIGTFLGMFVSAWILSYQPALWVLAALLFFLQFAIEVLVVRNYALAVVFITPLTVIFAEASQRHSMAELVLQTRMLNIVIGSALGLIAGGAIYLLRHNRISASQSY